MKIKYKINLVRSVFGVFLHSQKRYNGSENEEVIELKVELVAQLVEHNTFNVGALGSSPSGFTGRGHRKIASFFMRVFGVATGVDILRAPVAPV